MEVGFTTTCAISAYHHKICEFASCSWQGVLDTTLCDKVVSDLWQVGGFLQVLWFPPPIKLTHFTNYRDIITINCHLLSTLY